MRYEIWVLCNILEGWCLSMSCTFWRSGTYYINSCSVLTLCFTQGKLLPLSYFFFNKLKVWFWFYFFNKCNSSTATVKNLCLYKLVHISRFISRYCILCRISTSKGFWKLMSIRSQTQARHVTLTYDQIIGLWFHCSNLEILYLIDTNLQVKPFRWYSW